jgi:hypothetical protein
MACSLGLGAAAPAYAAEGATSAIPPEVIYTAGVEAMKAGKFADAAAKFLEVRRIKPDSTAALIGLSQCYEKLGKTASAWARYKELSVELKKKNKLDDAAAAAQSAADLEKVLSRVQINAATDTPGLIVRMDNEEVPKAVLGTPVPVDPGQHVLEATAPGYEVWQTTVTVGDKNDTRTVSIPGLTAKPVPANHLRTAAWAVGGVGAAGLVVGGVFGGLALSGKSKLTDLCANNTCTTQEGKDARAAANTKALVSTVGFAAGGAALATGIVLFVLSRPSAPKDEAAPPKAALVPTFGPQGGGLTWSGSF